MPGAKFWKLWRQRVWRNLAQTEIATVNGTLCGVCEDRISCRGIAHERYLQNSEKTAHDS